MIGAELGLGQGRLRFPGDGADREDDITNYTIGVRLRGLQNAIGQQTTYAVRYRLQDRDSTIDGFDRTQTTVTFDAVFGF